MIENQVLAALCAMTGVLFASAANASSHTEKSAVVGFIVAVFLILWPLKEVESLAHAYIEILPVNQLAFVIALLTLLFWLWPRFIPLWVGLGILLSSQWVPLLLQQGAIVGVAIFLWILTLFSAYGLTRLLPYFSNVRLRSEAALTLSTLSLTLALVPDLLTHWETAQRLNSFAMTHDNSSLPFTGAWLLGFIVIPVLLGLLYQYWRKS